MADANQMLTSNIAGSLQKYFRKRFMALPENDYDTVLVNAETGVAGDVVVPGSMGQSVEYRYFADIDPETTSATDHAPKVYATTAEPSTGAQLTATVVRMPLVEIVRYMSFGPFLLKTDPIDLMAKGFEALRKTLRRHVHQLVNQNMVNAISDTNSFLGDYSTAKLPTPFPTMYAGGATGFQQLTEESFITLRDVGRLVSAYENTPGQKNKYPDGTFRCVIDHAVKNQFMEDPKFEDFVKRHEQKGESAFQMNTLPNWKGVRFLVQDDPYRCQLPAANGDPNTRLNTGLVHCIHFLNYGAFGYVNLAGKTRMAPTFKSQDITITGIEITAGTRIPFQTSPIRANMGLNLMGTTEWNDQVTDFAIAA